MKNIALLFPFPLRLFGCLLCLSIWSGNLSAQHTVSGFTPAKEKTMVENPVPFSQRWLKIKSNERKVFRFAPVVEKTNHRLEFRKRIKTGEGRIFPANILDYANIYQVDGGSLVTFRFGSPGAKALRLKLSEVDLPEGAQILVYAASNSTNIDGPFINRGINDNGIIWTKNLPGEEIIVECFLPGNSIEKINAYFKLSELAHIYADPLQKSTQWQREQAAALCNVEVPAEWKEAAKSVAEIQFSSAGYIYSTLLNTANNTATPYLLTANHCVNRQSEADSLQTIWFKDSPTSTGQYGTSNAELVATGLAGDFTLLKL